MINVDKEIKKNINKARKFVSEASGDRPELSKKIGIGLPWCNKFALGHFNDPGYSKIRKILSYIDSK